MTESTNEGAKSETGSRGGGQPGAADNVRKAFAGLPLDQKISTLIQVELDMLGDAVESVVSVVSRAVDEVVSAFAPSQQSGEQAAASSSNAGGQTSAS